MSDLLTLVLVGMLSALVGGGGGALVAAFALKGEDKRFDARLVPVMTALEDLDDALLRWQRKVLKRDRDALRRPQSDDQAQPQGDLPLDRDQRVRTIRERARLLGMRTS